MDHTPFGLDEAMNGKVALQLSGHTHHGQMFPLNFITKMIYEKSWGYLRKGATQYYVSCGVGTWGPPVKTGSPSEIVNLKIKFVE
jgi:predicted MPP superfamily phosphohydrolase